MRPIYAAQDYGAMIDQFEMVSKRYGIVNKVVSVPNHPNSDEEIVELYEQQITPKNTVDHDLPHDQYYRADFTGKKDL